MVFLAFPPGLERRPSRSFRSSQHLQDPTRSIPLVPFHLRSFFLHRTFFFRIQHQQCQLLHQSDTRRRWADPRRTSTMHLWSIMSTCFYVQFLPSSSPSSSRGLLLSSVHSPNGLTVTSSATCLTSPVAASSRPFTAPIPHQSTAAVAITRTHHPVTITTLFIPLMSIMSNVLRSRVHLLSCSTHYMFLHASSPSVLSSRLYEQEYPRVSQLPSSLLSSRGFMPWFMPPSTKPTSSAATHAQAGSPLPSFLSSSLLPKRTMFLALFLVMDMKRCVINRYHRCFAGVPIVFLPPAPHTDHPHPDLVVWPRVRSLRSILNNIGMYLLIASFAA